MMAGALFYAARMSPMPLDTVEAPGATIESGAGTIDANLRPSFTLPDLDGVERDFAEWQGQHRLLNFWATWCAPCRREIPLLKAFQERKDEHGILVIGVAVDFPDAVSLYAEEAEFNYPILVGQEEAMAIADSSGIQFVAMPFTMIVSADGELLNAHLGEIFQDDIDHIVDVLARLDRGDIDKDGAREALATL